MIYKSSLLRSYRWIEFRLLFELAWNPGAGSISRVESNLLLSTSILAISLRIRCMQIYLIKIHRGLPYHSRLSFRSTTLTHFKSSPDWQPLNVWDGTCRSSPHPFNRLPKSRCITVNQIVRYMSWPEYQCDLSHSRRSKFSSDVANWTQDLVDINMQLSHYPTIISDFQFAPDCFSEVLRNENLLVIIGICWLLVGSTL